MNVPLILAGISLAISGFVALVVWLAIRDSRRDDP